MASKRIDSTTLILFTIVALSAFLVLVLGTSNGSILNAGYLVASLIFLLPAYWSLDIRHALAVRIYRKQALSLALAAIVIGLSSLPLISPTSTTALIISPAGFLSLILSVSFMVVILYFIDSTVLASRRSDPLLRDVLHWSQLRLVIWVWESFNIVFVISIYVYTIITGNVSITNQITNYSNWTNLPSLIYNLAWFVPTFSSLIIIPVVIRAKDPTLRRHFKWLAALGVVGIITVISFSVISSSQNLLDTLISNGALAYFIYKSAKSLVPLNRIPAS
ncbi:MAG: hypothetical protein OK457_07275 [Thaumarchaeota archaeon]|nr:hypothetical protein [Nitrososphaerota archaeon]